MIQRRTYVMGIDYQKIQNHVRRENRLRGGKRQVSAELTVCFEPVGI